MRITRQVHEPSARNGKKMTGEAAPDDPVIGIVLVNWNGWRDTVECLESLLRCGYGAWFVVCVDNGSADGSIERIEAYCAGTLPVESPLVAFDPGSKPVRFERLTARDAGARASRRPVRRESLGGRDRERPEPRFCRGEQPGDALRARGPFARVLPLPEQRHGGRPGPARRVRRGRRTPPGGRILRPQDLLLRPRGAARRDQLRGRLARSGPRPDLAHRAERGRPGSARPRTRGRLGRGLVPACAVGPPRGDRPARPRRTSRTSRRTT